MVLFLWTVMPSRNKSSSRGILSSFIDRPKIEGVVPKVGKEIVVRNLKRDEIGEGARILHVEWKSHSMGDVGEICVSGDGGGQC